LAQSPNGTTMVAHFRSGTVAGLHQIVRAPKRPISFSQKTRWVAVGLDGVASYTVLSGESHGQLRIQILVVVLRISLCVVNHLYCDEKRLPMRGSLGSEGI
jgi:hypothetical protein